MPSSLTRPGSWVAAVGVLGAVLLIADLRHERDLLVQDLHHEREALLALQTAPRVSPPPTRTRPALGHAGGLDSAQGQLSSATVAQLAVDAGRTEEATSIFETIAKTNKWGARDSISGDGSSLGNTEVLRTCLSYWFVMYNITSLVDAPCGDAAWQGQILGVDDPAHRIKGYVDRQGKRHDLDRLPPYKHAVRYRGFDISPTAVEKARAKHANNSNMQFGVLDLAAKPPPRADAIMVRDAIQHVPLAMGAAMLSNAKASGSRYLIVAHYQAGSNYNIDIGKYYKNNVLRPPFSLPPPLQTCPNYDFMSCTTPPGSCTSTMVLVDLDQWDGPDPLP